MNWGAPFVIAFIGLLIASATELSAGAADAANSIAVYGFYSLVVGIALQIASYVKYGEAGAASPPVAEPEAIVVLVPTRMPRRTKVAAVATVGLILLAAVVIGYPALLHTGLVTAGAGSSASSGTSSSSSSSGCSVPRNDGDVFISTNATVPVEICGQSFLVQAGAGGGLTYAYHAGLVNFTAPSSVNGSTFEFWYVIVGTNAATRVSSVSLSLNLPAGLTAQSSLIQLFYTAPPTSESSTTVGANTATSSTTSTSSTTAASSSSSTSSITTSAGSVATSSTNSTTTAAFCRGSDGGVFVSTNLNTTVSIDICGEAAAVPPGVGGGLDFYYHAGNVTFVAPTTVDGRTFVSWYVILPSGPEQVMSDQLTITLPAGFAPSDAQLEAFYA